MSGTDERTRATGPHRIAALAVATVLGGTIAGVAVIGSEALEPRLTQAASSALIAAGISGVGVRFDGREAVLTGQGADAGTLAEARRVVAAVEGVRWASTADTEAQPAPQPTSEPSPPDRPTAAELDELRGTEIRFSADSAALDAAGLRAVARVAVLLAAHPGLRLRLTGHIAIATGTPQEAVAFSAARAQAVADELMVAGIAADRLEIVGAGAADAVAGVDAGDSRNRRVSLEPLEAR